MKIINRKTVVLGIGLLTLGSLNFAQPSQAAPRDRGRYDRRYDRRDIRRTWSGRVAKVRSGNSFDIRVGGDTFNVYTNSWLPRSLSVGDRVSVRGVRQGSNDIRQASVSILRNLRNR